MNGFETWLRSRRIFLGFARQQDLADAACLSLTTVSKLETEGADFYENTERGTRRLLAWGLRTTVENLDKKARDRIGEVPFEPSPDELAEALGDVLKGANIPPIEWLGRLGDWLDRQSPEFRRFVVESVAQSQHATPAAKPATAAIPRPMIQPVPRGVERASRDANFGRSKKDGGKDAKAG